MSVRTDAIHALEQYPNRPLYPARGRREKRIWARLDKAEKKLEKARGRFIEHQQARGYTLWIMGGSRFEVDSPEAQRTVEVTKAITNTFKGINIAEGAGPGIMDAATQAFVATNQPPQDKQQFPGRNYAVGLQVSWEEKRDLKSFDYYVNEGELTPRVQKLSDLSSAVYVGPGALGTGYEFFTVMQLMQIKHFEPSYAIIVDPSWKPIIDECKKQWYTDRVAHNKTPLMDEHNLDFFFSDSIPDIVAYIGKSYNVWQEKIGKRIRRGHFWNKKV